MREGTSLLVPICPITTHGGTGALSTQIHCHPERSCRFASRNDNTVEGSAVSSCSSSCGRARVYSCRSAPLPLTEGRAPSALKSIVILSEVVVSLRETTTQSRDLQFRLVALQAGGHEFTRADLL